MYEVKCTIEGLSPMMMDRFFNPEDLEVSKKKAKTSWKDELKQKIYVDKKGVYVPADNIRMMLIGNQFRPGAASILGNMIEKKKKGEYLNFCKAAIWILGPKNPLKVYLEPKRMTFDEIDSRSFITANKGRGITRRPILNLPWKLNFVIQVTEDIFDQSKVKEFFDVAGTRCGCGAYGPTFGRFMITNWELVKK